MRSVLYKPKHDLIAQAISCIGQVELTPEDHSTGWFGLIPNGTSNLTFSLNDTPITYLNAKGDALLYPSWGMPAAIKRSRKLAFLNIMFNPCGLHLFSGIPSSEYHNVTLTPDQVFRKNELDELKERLVESTCVDERFRIIEKFLFRQFKTHLVDQRMTHAISMMKNSDLSIRQISEAVCLSPRRFRELFTLHTGFSPAHYRKLSRLNNSIHSLQGKSLTEVALANHYYDQSHFIRDFRHFTGITPSQFVRQKSKPADFYNFDLDDLTSFVAPK